MNEASQRNNRNRYRGKNFERRIAKLIHGTVVGRSKAVKVASETFLDHFIVIDPQHPPDVVNDWLSVECKYYANLPVWLTKLMAQAEGNCPDGLTPIGWVGDREERNRFVVMREQDFLDLHC